MKRFPVLVLSVVAAAVTCCGLAAGIGAAGIGPAMGATPAVGGHPVATAAAAVGPWDPAKEVPGSAALNTGGSAWVSSVSCPSAGNCAAGGTYTDSSGRQQVFVVGESGGPWGAAREVPGSAALNAGRFAHVSSVSCPSAGNCAAGGFYTDSSGHVQAFVAGEAGGAWGAAKEVPGLAALNAGGSAGVSSVSCPSAGNCAAGGLYTDSSRHDQAFVVNEVGGAWGAAEGVPGLAAFNAGGVAGVSSVSCPSAGNCAAGGFYDDGVLEAFVVNEAGGAWGAAEGVPGSDVLNAGGNAVVQSVSCPSVGNCAAVGYYADASFHGQGFVAGESGGSWGAAEEAPGLAALNAGQDAQVSSVSCVSAGNCAAGGTYLDSSGHFQAFVVGESGGSWGAAEEVPGSAALNAGGNARVSSVSCVSAGFCAAGGDYSPSGGNEQAFVDETHTSPASTSLSLSAAKVTYGDEQAEHMSVAVTSPGGTPGGTVTVKSGTSTVCTITLRSGKGQCSLAARQLRAGTYILVAVYNGNGSFTGSASAGKTLKVVS